MSDQAKCAVILGVIFGYVVVSLIVMWVSNVVSGYKGSIMDPCQKVECFVWPILVPVVAVVAVWLILVKPVVVLARLVVDTCPRLRVLTLLFHPFELGLWLRHARDLRCLRRLINRTRKGEAQ